MSRRSINNLATQFNATAAADANTMIANTDLQAGDPYVKSLKLLRDTIEDLINNDTVSNTAIALNTDKTGISTSQASAITANTAKTGISTSQASAITANTAKISTAVDLIPGTDIGKLLASVSENRGTYTLTFTYTSEDGRTTKTADIVNEIKQINRINENTKL